MKISHKIHSALTAVAAFLALTFSAHASSVLITPVGTGGVPGSGPVGLTGMFDAQPVGIPTIGTTTASLGAAYDIYNVGTVGYINFGASYATETITDVFILLKQYGTASAASFTYWWGNTPDLAFNPGAGDVSQSDLGLFSTPGSPNSNEQWIQVFSGSAAVAGQYLMFSFDSGSYGNRLSEVAIAGTTGVPEPTSLALACSGLVIAAMLIRRRRSQNANI